MRWWLAALLCGCSTSRPTPPTTVDAPAPTPRALLVASATPAGRASVAPPTPRRQPTAVASSPRATPRPTPVPRRTPRPAPSRTPSSTLRLPGPDQTTSGALGAVGDPSSAASWREYAERAVRAGAFSEASRAFAQEAAIYRRKGDREAALVEELKAARYRTQIELYYWRPTDEIGGNLARLEPPRGCMVGAFIDRDEAVGRRNFGSQRFGDVEDFNELTDKPHASFFTYLSFTNSFPDRWAAYLKENRAVPHLAWEPRDLREVTDEALTTFVDAVQRYGGPVILRFASEMNGEWTRYHRDPALYRATFRKVYQATRRAPRAALLWCPNAIPADKIAAYYPGDDACDWVGVNFYSVPFLDNDPRRPGDWIHPVDMLEPVYRTYAARKPMAIGEYAASHESSVDHRLRADFARLKIAQLYQSLPLRYPRLKLISWYDCNNIEKARQERQLNNFQLTDHQPVLEAYRHWVRQPHFLGAGQSSAAAEALPFPSKLASTVEIEPWVRSYEANPRVFLRLDGKVIAQWRLPEGGRLRLPTVPAGKHRLEVLVYDGANRLAGKRTFPYMAN
jgi:hypothetical protein